MPPGDQVGCFPCIKRVMLAVLMILTPTVYKLLQGSYYNEYWNSIVTGDELFADLSEMSESKKDPLFSKNYIIVKPPTSIKMLEALRLFMRNVDDAETCMAIGVAVYYFIVLAHFIAFCLLRASFIYNFRYRLITDAVYVCGAALCLGVAFGTFVDAFQKNRNWDQTKNIMNMLSKLNASEHQIYFSKESRSTKAENLTMSPAHLSAIADVCYKDFPYTMVALADFHHVFPKPLMTKIHGRFYHAHELAELGFCQYFAVKLYAIILLIMAGVLCISVPIIAWTQMRDLKLPSPTNHESNSAMTSRVTSTAGVSEMSTQDQSSVTKNQ